jgi:hypothetical protein
MKPYKILCKIIGLLIISVALLVCYALYAITQCVSDIGLAISGIIGITGAATTGLTLLCYIPILSVIAGSILIILCLFYIGYGFIFKA